MNINNFSYYIFQVDTQINKNDNQGLFEISGIPNGTAFSTCKDLLYISDDKNTFIIGSDSENQLTSVDYYKKLGGFKKIIRTNIKNKQEGYSARGKNEFMEKYGNIFKDYLEYI